MSNRRPTPQQVLEYCQRSDPDPLVQWYLSDCSAYVGRRIAAELGAQYYDVGPYVHCREAHWTKGTTIQARGLSLFPLDKTEV